MFTTSHMGQITTTLISSARLTLTASSREWRRMRRTVTLPIENAQLIINNKKLQEKYDNLVCGDNITHIADLTDQIKKLDKDIRHHKLAYRGADEENKKLKEEVKEAQDMVEQYSQDADRYTEAEEEVEKLKKDAEAWAIVRKHLAKDIEEYKKVAKRLTEMSLFARPSLTDEEIDDLYDKY